MKTNEELDRFRLAEEEYANSYKSIREISKKYSLAREAFYGWLLAKGHSVYNRRASKYFDVEYFDSIDTEEKAYWLGFLFADGALSQYKNSYRIELSLKLEDAAHVEKFAKAIRKEYTMKKVYRARCILGSKNMFNTLVKYGCTLRKSLTLKFPDKSIFKNESLIRHFIRGYFDGDGCISYGNKEHTYPNVTILGTKEFLDGIQEVYGSNHKYQNANKGQEITKLITYSGKAAFEFIKWLYEDSTVYLERKFNRYKDFCRLYE